MLRRRPDLAERLFEPFFVDRKGEIPEGKLPYYQLPIFNYHAGHLSTIYARDFIDGAQRFPDVPRFTAAQTEAMDMLDALAGDDGIRLDMQLATGDMQFLHNHQTLHARTAYEDYPEPERRRHLLRLWLSPPNGRQLPPAVVVPREEHHNVDPKEIIEFCREHIAGYKVPKAIDIQHEPLPKSGPGKVLKRELRAPFWKGKESSVN